MVLGALSALLELSGDIKVVGRAADGAAALDLIRVHKPDVIVSDIEMPGLTGIELAAMLTAEKNPARVLIVTTFGRPGYLRRALDAGVRGENSSGCVPAPPTSCMRTTAFSPSGAR